MDDIGSNLLQHGPMIGEPGWDVVALRGRFGGRR